MPASPESKRYILGPAVEVGLPWDFTLELEALYHRHGYSATGFQFAQSENDRERANSWEFPVLVNYHLSTRGIQPFVSAGVAPRSISGTIEKTLTTLNVVTRQTTTSTTSMETNWAKSLGLVGGLGVRCPVGRLLLSPEVRFTHWSNLPVSGAILESGAPFQSARNQVDLLVGFRWKLH